MVYPFVCPSVPHFISFCSWPPIFHVIKGDLNANDKTALSSEVEVEKKLFDICWTRVSTARTFGVIDLKARHEKHFSEKMSQTEITLGSANKTQTCSYGSVTGRLKSFGAGCKNDELDYDVDIQRGDEVNGNSNGNGNGLKDGDTNEESNIESNMRLRGKMLLEKDKMASSTRNDLEKLVDVNLISQAYTYGRYLLLSTATGTAINLQGLWTDGPSASWNGKSWKRR